MTEEPQGFTVLVLHRIMWTRAMVGDTPPPEVVVSGERWRDWLERTCPWVTPPERLTKP